jgi:para-nitrobenzyl esterase
MSQRFFVIAMIVLFLGLPSAAQPGTVVTIESGKVQGSIAQGVLSFKGIRYAAPPIGRFRWRAPQPVKPWQGVRNALRYGSDCIQKPVPGDAAPLGGTMSEDCLYLNIWRPATELDTKPLPVMVWIHGGGYVNGGTSTPIFDGSSFARQGIVLVSFNYRLGRFGFFSHPALVAAKEGPVGNFGYMDQLAALKWVQRNIAAFGGDPNQVTIFGESAGGSSVIHLLTSPVAEGLFHRAIVLSGGGRSALLGGRKLSGGTNSEPSADQIGVNFAKSVGIKGTGPEALKALRALPAEKVRGNLNMIGLFAAEVIPIVPLWYTEGPVVDGVIVTDSPDAIFRQGKAAKVPLIIGSTTDDLSTSLPRNRKELFAPFGADAEIARRIYDPTGKGKWQDIRAAVGADRTMHEPARFVAKQMSAAGNPVWLYRFGYVAESQRAKSKGAGHASELPFVFNTLTARFGSSVTAKDKEAAQAIHTYLANFAKSGDPNGSGLPAWSKYDPAKSDMMIFTLDNGALVKPDPWRTRLDLVEKAVEKKP